MSVRCRKALTVGRLLVFAPGCGEVVFVRSDVAVRARLFPIVLVLPLLALAGCASEASPAADSSDINQSSAASSPDASSPFAPDPVTGEMDYADPEIDAPPVEPCPYAAEVDAVAFDDKFQRALDLGCEHDIHGDITFTEPIKGPDGEMLGLLSPDHALSMKEMHEAGYISDADFQEHLEFVEYTKNRNQQ